MMDRQSDRPVYQQLADLLAGRIREGTYPPGAAIPSEVVLRQRCGVARNTVRLAMGRLREQGLVVTRHGRGTFVRERRPVRRRSPGEAAPGCRIVASHAEVRASGRVAGLLDVPAGTPVLERRALCFDGSDPQEISTSYVPLAVVAGTPIADPQRPAWELGPVGALASVGVRVTEVHEVVRARMPYPDEVRSLHVDSGTPMLTITRTVFAGDRPVEAAVDVVVPADRVELGYRISAG